jgi:hypothetical protein
MDVIANSFPHLKNNHKLSEDMYSRLVIFIFLGRPLQHSQTSNEVVDRTLSLSTADHENDGNANSNVTSLSFVSRQKRRQIAEKACSQSKALVGASKALIAFACYNSQQSGEFVKDT